MNVKLFIVSAFAITIAFSNSIIFAYDGSVHSAINEKSARLESQLDSKLKLNIGLAEGVNYLLQKDDKILRIHEWLAYGGEGEDYGWPSQGDASVYTI